MTTPRTDAGSGPGVDVTAVIDAARAQGVQLATAESLTPIQVDTSLA